MKRYGNLYDSICSRDNILLAHEKAKRGKTHYSAVKRVNSDLDNRVSHLQQMLVDRTFTTSNYEIEEREIQGKTRVIYKLPYYPDRIVHHCICNVCGPIWRRSFIRDTFQSIEGRGVTDARRRVSESVTNYNYSLKIDINKFYPSIDNLILSEMVRYKIKCKDTLDLIDDIVFSTTGLPIGNHISQYLGNLYLTYFDWWIKQSLKFKGYFRYCDDMVLFSNSKEELHSALKHIKSKLDELRLSIKDNYQIYDLYKQGIDFCGYKFYNNGIVRIRKRIVDNYKRNMNNPNSLPAYWGWIKPLRDHSLWYKYQRRDIHEERPYVKV